MSIADRADSTAPAIAAKHVKALQALGYSVQIMRQPERMPSVESLVQSVSDWMGLEAGSHLATTLREYLLFMHEGGDWPASDFVAADKGLEQLRYIERKLKEYCATEKLQDYVVMARICGRRVWENEFDMKDKYVD